MPKNTVISGDYAGCIVGQVSGLASIFITYTETIALNKDNVETYEIIDETKTKSATNMATRGLVGGLLLGPVGMLAGALTSKSKGTYIVAIYFKGGGKSLLEVDEKIYKAIVTQSF